MVLFRASGRRGNVALVLGVVAPTLLLTAAFGKRAILGPVGEVPNRTETPTLHVHKASELPAPFATPSADNPPKIIARPEEAALTVPPGFHVSEWAEGLDNPRILTVAPCGDVFVAES